ncbi:MAG: Flp pilus assembly complex ATPase component TadA [Deltaproteobacteria bacterium]|nr:Flp pilus assembly complex ATPase component TadA [Deltaproteobacteria bacterium]
MSALEKHRRNSLDLKDVCELLLKRGVITSEQQAMILEKQHQQTEKLLKLQALRYPGENFAIVPADIISSLNLLDQKAGKGFITEETVMMEAAAALGIAYKKIDPLELDLEVVTRTISKAFAIKNLAVPVAVENGELKVAMIDPFNREVLDDLRQVQKLQVTPVMSTKSDIIKLIREFYGFKKSIIMAERELGPAFTDIGNFEQYAKLGSVTEIESTDKYIQNAVDYLFRYAFEQRASDIHLEPKRDKAIVRLRIDGVLYVTYTMPLVVHNAVVSRIKSISRLNIAERRRPQDGRIKLKDKNRDVEIRVSTVPVAFGEKAVLRVLNPDVLFQDLENLGFTASDLVHYRECLEKPHGIILVTGPTGSGKTTTLYSSLKSLASADKNITTVEDPIEMVCEEYNQIAVQPSIDITFSSILRNILRQDPDIIMIGEIRDRETAKNAIQAALTGHLVLSTLHTNDAASAFTRLIDLGVEPFLISSTMLGVIAQRLVRIICPHCQEAFTLSSNDLKRLGIGLFEDSDEETVELKRGAGCRQCRTTGYQGREGVFEVLRMTEEIKKLINEGAPAEAIKKTACRQGMRPLRDNAAAKILKGRTTYTEVLRCISQEE